MFSSYLFTFSLLVTIQASSVESPQEAMIELIYLDEPLLQNSLNEIERLRSETAVKLTEILNLRLRPDLEKAFAAFEARIENLGIPLAPSDSAACIEEVTNAASRFLNRTMLDSRAVQEKDIVYDKMLQYIIDIGRKRIGGIQQKMFDIWESLRSCLATPHPEVCSVKIIGQIRDRTKAISEKPKEYEVVVENSQSQMLELQESYQSRYTSYINHTENNLQPFIALMETCVSSF